MTVMHTAQVTLSISKVLFSAKLAFSTVQCSMTNSRPTSYKEEQFISITQTHRLSIT